MGINIVDFGNFEEGRDKIGILIPVERILVIADLLRKEGLNPIITNRLCPIGAVVLDIMCTSQEDFEAKSAKVMRVMNKEMIDYHRSN